MCVCVCVCVQTHIYRYVLGCAQSLHACVQLFVTPWTIAHQALLHMVFSRLEYWSGLPFPTPGDLLHPGIETRSHALQVHSLPSEPPGIYDQLFKASSKMNLSFTMVNKIYPPSPRYVKKLMMPQLITMI